MIPINRKSIRLDCGDYQQLNLPNLPEVCYVIMQRLGNHLNQNDNELQALSTMVVNALRTHGLQVQLFLCL
jgi:hypothetical protein